MLWHGVWNVLHNNIQMVYGAGKISILSSVALLEKLKDAVAK